MIVTRTLLQAILAQYRLPHFGTHGVSHWARVYENGLRLSAGTGANLRVVQLFAVFHDSRRTNEGWDLEHGRLGAEFAASLRGVHFDLPDAEFELLYAACAQHTDGQTEGDITIQTCWDADRLDLGRVNIPPSPKYLCTPAARDPEVIAWANRRSETRIVPAIVHDEWAIPKP